jgi:hypothetical protein
LLLCLYNHTALLELEKSFIQLLWESGRMKIGILGKGHVGNALATGLSHAGHEIKFGHRDPEEPVAEAAKWGEVIIFAVPHDAVADVAEAVGSAADGKVLVDVTNAIGDNMGLAVGFSTSAAEELQKMLPKARVVKAFNTCLRRTSVKAGWVVSSLHFLWLVTTRVQRRRLCGLEGRSVLTRWIRGR